EVYKQTFLEMTSRHQNHVQIFTDTDGFKIDEKVAAVAVPPKGGRGCLMSPPCLESQGCHLIPLCYLLSCSSA
ncbi:hypothetical protein, partial [Thiolapillus sp.]|uniref:hypothetical protein n=1 Tax=Thiolapillus sp. TaxID=2017437 RepID=UPI003AF9240A